jgi:4-amino-4-deoxy-L-arabinose transferase-like glycosyltransferase
MRRLLTAHWPALVLVLLAYPLLLMGLDRYSLVNGDEGIYHAVSVNMANSGDWIRLYYRGEHIIYPTFVNAPLQYWARAAVIVVFGDSYWTMRIWSALFATLTVVLTYRVGLLIMDRGGAFLAGLLQLTTFQFVYLHSGRTGELEPMLAFALLSSAYCFIRSMETGLAFARSQLPTLFVMLLKTPAVLIPIAAQLTSFVAISDYRTHLRRWAMAAALVLPLGLIWHAFRLPELWEPLQSVLSTMAAEASGIGLPEATVADRLSFYTETILHGAFPYSLLYPVALVGVLRLRGSDKAVTRRRVIALFAVAVLGFYLAITKRFPWYIIPAYPLLSLLVADWLVELFRRDIRPISILLVCVLVALIGWADLSMTTFNPFAIGAFHIPMTMQWRVVGETSTWLGITATAALLSMACLFARRMLSAPQFTTVFALIFTVVLVAYGSIRTSMALQHLDHQSGLAKLHARLTAMRSADQPLTFPIRIPGYAPVPVRYFFADDYEIVPDLRPGAPPALLLYDKDDPSALPNSISKGR